MDVLPFLLHPPSLCSRRCRWRAWALRTLRRSDQLRGHLQASDMSVVRPQDSLVLRVLLPSDLVVQNCWHSCVDLSDDCLAEASIHLRSLVIEDAGSEVDDDQRVLDERETVNDSFDGLGLDFLKVVLCHLLAQSWTTCSHVTHLVRCDEQTQEIVQHTLLLDLGSQYKAREQRPGGRVVGAINLIEHSSNSLRGFR
jgi:hypothetical protein